jgi:hypothetical protein
MDNLVYMLLVVDNRHPNPNIIQTDFVNLDGFIPVLIDNLKKFNISFQKNKITKKSFKVFTLGQNHLNKFKNFICDDKLDIFITVKKKTKNIGWALQYENTWVKTLYDRHEYGSLRTIYTDPIQFVNVLNQAIKDSREDECAHNGCFDDSSEIDSDENNDSCYENHNIVYPYGTEITMDDFIKMQKSGFDEYLIYDLEETSGACIREVFIN